MEPEPIREGDSVKFGGRVCEVLQITEHGITGELIAKVRFLTEIVDDFRRFVDEIWLF